MTVQYYQEVLSAGPVAFLKLLRKWKGGVLKLIYMDFIVFSLLYAGISCIYRFLLKCETQRQFEKVVRYVYNSQSLIPVAFILGFYVSLVFGRFWKHFNTVPWIPKLALLLSSHLVGEPGEVGQNEARIQRRSIIRYMVAAQILTLSRVSVPVKRRFPQVADLCAKGILLEHEAKLIADTEPFTMQPFLPISWCTAIVMKAGTQGRIANEAVLINTVKEINRFRQLLQELFLLDQVCVPLVYTQVVTLAVYSYFLSCLIGRQFIIDPINSTKSEDFVVPIFTILQFIVYMGWLKLALTLVNPMGEDDEDFDLNCVVDYNFEVGIAIVDNLHSTQPPLVKDKFFNQKEFDLPMESGMKDAKSKPFMGSVYDMKLEGDSWVTSLRSIVTVDADGAVVRKSSGNINKLDSIIDASTDGGSKTLVRSLSTESQRRLSPDKRPLSGQFGSSKIEETESVDEAPKIIIATSPVLSRKKDKQPLIAIEEEEHAIIEMEVINKVQDEERVDEEVSNEAELLLQDARKSH